MGKLFKAYLNRGKVWSCYSCAAHLAYHEDIISKNFQGKHGRAYLINHVINVGLGETEERRLMTGLHTVADIHCNVCDNVLGWKYALTILFELRDTQLQACDEAQKYKESKFLVEKAKIVKDKAWT